MAIFVATVRWQLKVWVNNVTFAQLPVWLLIGCISLTANEGLTRLDSALYSYEKWQYPIDWVCLFSNCVSMIKRYYTTFIFHFIGWFSVLPLKWEQDCHVNGDGRNLVVLLNSTWMFQLSSVRVVTEMVSITISLTSEVDRNCCDARHVELQGLVQISSQAG